MYRIGRETVLRPVAFVLLIAFPVTAFTAPGHWINDGSQATPRLSVEQSLWAMGGLPRGRNEWSGEEKLRKIAAAGFDGVMVFYPSHQWSAQIAAAKAQQLAITLQCAPETLQEFGAALDVSQSSGARGIVALIRPTFVSYEEGTQKIQAMMAASAEVRMPFYLETHRKTITQDLLLTARWAREIPNLQFHADLSHFVISYEVSGRPEKPVQAAFDAILARTGMIDGRVGNGEQVQIDIGDGNNSHAKRFASWWQQAMVTWLRQAEPGDVFVFKSELGPPEYAIVGADGQESSDRWAQAFVMRRLGIETWNNAVREAGRGQFYQVREVAVAETKASAPRGIWPTELTPKKAELVPLRGISHQLGEFYLTGQLAQPDFERAKKLGVKTVINVRMLRELSGLGFDEDFVIQEMGLDYVHIPVSPMNLDDARAEKFLNAVRKAKKPLLIHGSNGNRLWGLWALYMGMEYGVSVDTTAKVARRMRVRKLVVDKFVRQYLAQNAPKS